MNEGLGVSRKSSFLATQTCETSLWSHSETTQSVEPASATNTGTLLFEAKPIVSDCKPPIRAYVTEHKTNEQSTT